MALRSWTSICFLGALLILNVSATRTFARNLHDVKADPATLDAVDAAKNVVHTEVAKSDAADHVHPDKAEPAKNVDSTVHESDEKEVKPDHFGGFPGAGFGGGFPGKIPEQSFPIKDPIVGGVPIDEPIVGDPGDLPGGEWGGEEWGGGGGGGGKKP